jgi:hypothetical protein
MFYFLQNYVSIPIRVLLFQNVLHLLVVQNESVSTTSKTCGNGIRHTQSNSHSTDKPIDRNFEGKLFYF